MSLRLRLLITLLALGLPALTRAQHFPFPEFEEERTMPALALHEGLRVVDIVEFDSGGPPRYSSISFHWQHDSLWESARLEGWRSVDSSVTLYDSALHVLFKAEYHGAFGNRTATYFLYDGLGRMVRSTELNSLGNSASVSQFSYSEHGDTCWTMGYLHSSEPSSIQTSILDAKGRVIRRTANGADSQWLVEHTEKYDSLDRKIEELTRTNKNAYLNIAIGSKRAYQDSVGVLRCTIIPWEDSVWSSKPSSEWRYDSLARRKYTTNFSSKYPLLTTEQDDYDAKANLVHTIYDDPNIHFQRIDDYSYGSHGELLSYEMKHNGNPHIKTIYHYTYHK